MRSLDDPEKRNRGERLKGCAVYRLSARLSALRRRLQVQDLGEAERLEIEQEVRDLEKKLDV